MGGLAYREEAAGEAVEIQQDTFACSSEFSLHALYSNGGGGVQFLNRLVNPVGSWTLLEMDVKVSAGILYMGKRSVAFLRSGRLDGEAENLSAAVPLCH